jgi:hypothetical protein
MKICFTLWKKHSKNSINSNSILKKMDKVTYPRQVETSPHQLDGQADSTNVLNNDLLN